MVLLQQALTIALDYTALVVGWTATNKLRSNLFNHCIGLDLSFHHTYTPGYLIERIDGDISQLRNFFSLFAVKILGNVLLLAGVQMYLFFIDTRLGIGFLVFSITSLAVFYVVRNTAVSHAEALTEERATLFGFLEEHLDGVDDIRSSGAVRHVRDRLRKSFGNLFEKHLKFGTYVYDSPDRNDHSRHCGVYHCCCIWISSL